MTGYCQVLEIVDYGIEEANNQLLKEINRKERKLLANEIKMGIEENVKLSIAIDNAKQQLELSTKIYEHYEKMVEAVETVSNTVKTMREVREFHDYLSRIMLMYKENGVRIATNSLYEYDKYLDPDQHEKYMKLLTGLYEQTLRVVSKFNIVINNNAKGVKANEYERWKAIREYNREIKKLYYSMQKVVYMMNYLAPARQDEIDNNIAIKKSFYNIDTYAK